MGSHHHYEPYIVYPMPTLPPDQMPAPIIVIDAPPTDPGPLKLTSTQKSITVTWSHQHKEDHMETIANVKALRKRVAATKTVEDGTVVKFTYAGYTYVALFIAGMWWTSVTSRSYRVQEKYTDAMFMELLGRAEDVQVATAWEAL